MERDSQKAIVIGRRGSKIRRIVSEATRELEELFRCGILLDIRVKVQPKWRKKEHVVRRIVN